MNWPASQKNATAFEKTRFLSAVNLEYDRNVNKEVRMAAYFSS